MQTKRVWLSGLGPTGQKVSGGTFRTICLSLMMAQVASGFFGSMAVLAGSSSFNEFLGKLPHPHKIVIAGNRKT